MGPLPAGTYWARRAGVLGVPLVLLLVASSCLGSGGDPDTVSQGPGPTPSRSASATPATATTPSAGAPAAPVTTCPDAVLLVGLDAAPDTSPRRFEVTVTNRGTVACRRDLGPGAVQLVVTSGQDRIWARSDCTPAAREVATLAPGASRAIRVAWDRKRSRPGCTGTRAPATTGTYRVTGTVGGVALPTEVFQIG